MDPRQAVPSAVALELFQNFALVHDDIEDGSLVRRGKPALHRLHGIPLATNAGDLLFGLVYEALLDNAETVGPARAVQVMREFAEVFRRTFEGLYPEDIETLYPLVEAGMPGEILYQPVKFGQSHDRVFIEVHQDVYQMFPNLEAHAFEVLDQSGLANRVDREAVRAAVRARTGVPTDVTRGAPPGVHVVHAAPPEGDV